MTAQHASLLILRSERLGCQTQHRRLVWSVAASLAAITSCGGQPTAPERHLVTISGYVYEQETSGFGEPFLANVLITVKDGEGSEYTARSNGDGFYTVSVRSGTVSITASKDGYTTQASQFAILNNTVLNFSLPAA